jgi:hypothetical protein
VAALQDGLAQVQLDRPEQGEERELDRDDPAPLPAGAAEEDRHRPVVDQDRLRLLGAEVAGEAGQLAQGAGGVGAGGALGVLLHGDPAVREGFAQDGDDAFPVGVGRAQVAHAGDLPGGRAMGDVHR